MTGNRSAPRSASLDAIARRAGDLLAAHDVSVRNTEVVVGCSGGADSTVLLHVLIALGARPVVVHVNYRLRGPESERDEMNVRMACEELGLALTVERPDDVHGLVVNGSLQEAARRVRYGAFSRIAMGRSIPYVAVGHTLDDQSETVLLQLMRGSGVRGLAGMRVVTRSRDAASPIVIRPLLTSSREEVVRAAGGLSTKWAVDASNSDPRFARARIRSRVLPAIEESFGRSHWLNIGRSGLRAGDIADARADEADRLVGALTTDSEAALSVDALLAVDPLHRGHVILEAIRRWAPELPETADSVQRIERLLRSQPGRQYASGGSVVIRDRTDIVFRIGEGAVEPRLLHPGEAVRCGPVTVHLHELAQLPRSVDPQSRDVAYVDLDVLESPLVVRSWQPGDRVKLLGTEGTKLVSDILTDARVPVRGRDAVSVVLSGTDVVWVVGTLRSALGLLADDTSRAGILLKVPASRDDSGTDAPAPKS